jgi:outer membrane protein assembly factor BamB
VEKLMRVLTATLVLVALGAHAANNDGPPSADPGQLYQQNCAACHDHPAPRIPARATIAHRSADEVMQILALSLRDGQQLWRAPPPAAACSWGPHNCLAAQSQAATAIPGVVFSGSEDGHLRAYASQDGRVIWDVDTAKSYTTVNAVEAAGGSLDNGGPTLAAGMLFVNSGYGRIVGEPGNVLLAFSVDGH